MSHSPESTSLLCIKAPVQQTEFIKKHLISLGIFLKNFKLIKEKNFIYLPISDGSNLPAEFVLEKRVFEVLPKKISYQETLREVLPKQLHECIPSSFDRIGDVLLVKLDPALSAYALTIGNIFLDSFKLRSVFSKGSDVESEFRTIDWQCIAGVDDPIVFHSMHGFRWKVNIREVYFNSRLSNEYLRIAELCHDHDVIIDMFAGIGPFALLCARQKPVQVYALDINPTAISLLKENIDLNRKYLTGTITALCGDSKELVKELPHANSIIMNLPGYAIEFLEAAVPKIMAGGKIFMHQFIHLSKEEKKLSLDSHAHELEKKLLLLTEKLQLTGCSWKIVGNKLRDVSPSKIHVVWDITRTN